MPTIIIEGPPLPIKKKRELVSSITNIVSKIYNWPAKNIIVIIHENPDDNVGRGGILVSDRPNNKKRGG
jgi:4-oxalocrotonate tautomerase